MIPSFNELGFSQYETKAYLSLLQKHPVNGSQLSRISGIPRGRVYDVLRSLESKGIVAVVGDGLYSPLPPEELVKRLHHNYSKKLSILKKHVKQAQANPNYEYVWTIKGYAEVIDKAREIIMSAEKDLYVRLHLQEGQRLDDDLHRVESRGVSVKYISMGPPFSLFKLQIIHPPVSKVSSHFRGRSFDIIADWSEALIGRFEDGKEHTSSVSWAKNHWIVVTNRDRLRHDFFHYFLHKIVEEGQQISEEEKVLYEIIKNDI